MNRIWNIKKPEPELSVSLAETLRISPITAQLLINRGIHDEMQAHHFLYGDLQSTHDPMLLKDMEKSVLRIKKAIKRNEKILIYGDYDVDGITSVALLSRVFAFLKADIVTYIPNRLEEGYGLNEKAVKFAHSKKIKLLVTVDCGISAHKEIALANKYGIDTIITDHHEIKSENLPSAYSIVNPHQLDCAYPFKYLAGVGIAYKLAKALTFETSYPVDSHLDLVALGTVSDLSAQKGENRILTKAGLMELNKTKNLGIKALCNLAGLKGKNVSSRHIGYILGPRINAMGRIGSPEFALRLLMTDKKEEADRLAEVLNTENRNRQRIESKVLEEALERIERTVNFKETKVIVLASQGWHTGVIGIVASRIVDRYYRPTIMISLEGKRGKGSGRSIDKFHLFNAINETKDHLLDFGGHEGACGLLIEKNRVSGFSKALNDFAGTKISDEDLYPKLDIDIEVPLSHLSEELIEELELLVPFGPENPRPIFTSNNLHLKHEPRRIAKSGIKMWVSDDKKTCEAISFRGGSVLLPNKGTKVNLAYSPSLNTWQGLTSLQLDLKDLKIS